MNLFSTLDFGFWIVRPTIKHLWGLALGALLLAFSFSAGAQQRGGEHSRIGFLWASALISDAPIKTALRELGYIEGRNITIEHRYAQGKLDRLSALAADLVRLKVDVIVTGGSTATRAAKEATSTIPIVMSQDNDPVGSGFIAGLARPGGNITGLSTLRPELSGKRLELLKEIIPKLSRVAVLGDSDNPGDAEGLRETELAAGALGLKLQYLDIRSPKHIETAFLEARKGFADGALVLGGPVLNVQPAELAKAAAKSRLPTVYARRSFVEAGGLMSYGVNVADLHRRAAFYVDKILRGGSPAEMPVEQPNKFELVINLKTAKQIGVAIPLQVLARADKVIK